MEELEALKAELEELKKGNEALANKNKELLGEMKKAKAKTDGVDVEKFFQMSDELESLKAEYAKVTKLSKLETEKLMKSLSDKDSALQKYLIDNGLMSAFTSAGVTDPLKLDLAISKFKTMAQVREDNGELKAFIGDKALNDAVNEWIGGAGKDLVTPAQAYGGGAGGGGQGGAGDLRKYFDKTSPDFNLTKQAEIYQQNPQLFEQLKG